MRKGVCTGCGKANVWVNTATANGTPSGEYCGGCFEDLDHDDSRGRGNAREDDRDVSHGGDPSWRHNSDPWQENAVRELENTQDF